jgi:hypothetical protein
VVLIDMVKSTPAVAPELNHEAADWQPENACRVNRPTQAAESLRGWREFRQQDRIVNQQAQIVAYANDYMLLIVATLPAWLLLLTMRLARQVMAAEDK